MSNFLDDLINLEVISKGDVRKYFPRVRDRDDVEVLRCEKSEVIFLASGDHIESSYYSEKSGTSYWSCETRAEGLKATKQDDARRFHQNNDRIKGARYLDIGTGLGGILDLARGCAASVAGVEPQEAIREVLAKEGYEMYGSLQQIPKSRVFDVVTLFHVFEHLLDPFETLKKIYSVLEVGGGVIIEVPHARDALLTTYDLESFKKFTLWSEHLILHTKASLARFLEAAGFVVEDIVGFQRYPISNHLYWLLKGLPGGQSVLNEFRDLNLENSYEDVLQKLDRTDTIVAYARKRSPG